MMGWIARSTVSEIKDWFLYTFRISDHQFIQWEIDTAAAKTKMTHAGAYREQMDTVRHKVGKEVVAAKERVLWALLISI